MKLIQGDCLEKMRESNPESIDMVFTSPPYADRRKKMEIDWSEFTWPEDTCHCRCGKIFKSHAKYMAVKGIITKKQCPQCGKNNDCWRVASDPEVMTI